MSQSYRSDSFWFGVLGFLIAAGVVGAVYLASHQIYDEGYRAGYTCAQIKARCQ